MRLLDHYEVLFASLETRRRHEDGYVPVTVPQLAGLLSCTERNAKLLVRSMSEAGWIEWHPGRGRGRLSSLRFRMRPEKLLADRALVSLAQGRESDALSILRSGKLGEPEKERLLAGLNASFGVRVEEETAGRKETLRFPAYRPVGALDPAYVSRRTELHLVRQLFDTLLVFDRPGGCYTPALAHHWERSSSGTSWVFNLRKHVRFHHGRTLTADDVAYTFERLAAGASASPYRRLFASIRSVLARHDHETELVLDEPNGSLPALLASACASIVPRDGCEGREAQFARLPAGTGPFRLVRHDDDVVIMEAFADYYGRCPLIDRVEMWAVPQLYESGTAEAELEQSGANFMHYPYDRRSEPVWEQQRQTDRGCKFMTVNAGKTGPLRNEALRSAIAAAIDPAGMAAELEGNRGAPARRFVLDDEREAGERVSDLPGPAYAEFGDVKLRLVTYEGAGNERDAEWLCGRLAAHGVETEVVYVPYDRMCKPETIDAADIMLMEQPVDDDEEWALLTLLADPDSAVRRHAPEDESSQRQTDDVLHAVHAEDRREQRLRLLRLLEERAVSNRTLIHLYRWHQFAHYPKALRGVRIGSLGWVEYRELWFAHADS